MKSVMERQIINGAKRNAADKKAAELSYFFLEAKYEAARGLFSLIGKLRLVRPTKAWRGPFGFFYLADKLTQRHTFGRYDGTKPEHGSRYVDYTSVSPVPAWFSQSLEMDKN